MNIELRHLRALEAVGEHRSFTQAARVLHITQPALSRTIQQLETRLGVTLMVRTSRSVRLTAPGEVLLQRSRKILRDVQVALAEVSREPEFRVGFPWALPDPWVSRTTAQFEASTGVGLRLSRRDDIHAALLDKTVDVALSRRDISSEEVECVELAGEVRVAAVSTRSPLVHRTSISWNELGRYPLVVNTVSGNTRPTLWDDPHRPRTILECHNYDEWAALVASGRGVGATPRSAMASHGHTGVVSIPLDDAPPVPLCLAWLRGEENPLVRAFHTAAVAHLPERPRPEDSFKVSRGPINRADIGIV